MLCIFYTIITDKVIIDSEIPNLPANKSLQNGPWLSPWQTCQDDTQGSLLRCYLAAYGLLCFMSHQPKPPCHCRPVSMAMLEISSKSNEAPGVSSHLCAQIYLLQMYTKGSTQVTDINEALDTNMKMRTIPITENRPCLLLPPLSPTFSSKDSMLTKGLTARPTSYY